MFKLQLFRGLTVAGTVVLLGSGCASTGPTSGATARSPAQLKQQELSQMEKQGQRNDIDKPLK
jgi:hypothetical protein